MEGAVSQNIHESRPNMHIRQGFGASIMARPVLCETFVVLVHHYVQRNAVLAGSTRDGGTTIRGAAVTSSHNPPGS